MKLYEHQLIGDLRQYIYRLTPEQLAKLVGNLFDCECEYVGEEYLRGFVKGKVFSIEPYPPNKFYNPE